MTFDRLMARVSAGEHLPVEEISWLADAPDLLSLGMLADAVRRLLHGTQVTYVRVASCAFDQPGADSVPPTAREVRLTGTPGTFAAAVAAVERAKAVAGDRGVSGFSWLGLGPLGSGAGGTRVAQA